ncbi:MAG: glycosyltransferase family 2 protein [Candidatus Marinimicrobia bacterium]|nr:glycosyltransferase family 2 protein [Candidatus Neomarinimicrobiota bacterium]
MKEKKLSVVIITRNEAKNIAACLQSVQWADEVILVDSGSTDKTREIAQKAGAKIISLPFKELAFAQWRNEGLKAAKGKWLLYVDADERVTPELKKEIETLIKGKPDVAAYQIPRRNYYLGKEVRYGGAWPNYVKRLFLREKLKRWEQKLHEDPVFEGELGTLKNPLLHQAHQSLTAMMAKTSQWSKIEAELLDEAHHPPVTWWRILRMMLTEFWERGIKLQGWRDGTVGWIELIFQMFSRFATYAQLWELQQKKKKS